MTAYDLNVFDYEDAEIIQFCNKMALCEIKLLYLFMTMAAEFPDKRSFTAEKTELERLFEVTRFNNADLKSRVNTLAVTAIQPSEYEIPVLIFDRIRYERNWLGSWECRFSFSERFTEYMRDKMPFTSVGYYCGTAAKLNNKRSFLLYVYLLKHGEENIIRVTLPELRNILGACDKYKSFKEFNRNVFKKSVYEIQQKTDMKFGYRLAKNGTRTVGIQFEFETEEEPIKTPYEQTLEFFRTAFENNFTLHQTEEIYNIVKELPLPEHNMGREFAVHDFLREMYLILKRYTQTGRVNNEYVYFLRMLRNKREEAENK